MKKNLSYLKFLSSATVLLFGAQSYNSVNAQSILKYKTKTPIIAQIQSEKPNQDVLIPNPTILIDGKPVQPSQPTPPPYLPKAVAPPVGDMAISNIENTAPNLVKLGSNAILPRLVLREAPVKEVLSLLARSAGYNLVFTGGESETPTPNISLEIENEGIEDVFNWVLMVSGLNAGKKGNTIFVGTDLPFAARDVITRSIRMNQYNVPAAASFLGSQGASVKIVDAEVEGEGKDRKITYEIKETYLEEAKGEKLILRGLTVHGDEEHDQIVLVGPPHLVEIATNFLTQLDVRRRQVALNVKVMVVRINNEQSLGMNWFFGNSDYQVGVTNENGLGINILENGRFNGVADVFGNPIFPNVFATIQAKITNGNLKILADPTLIVQEGQSSEVKLTEKVITNIKTEVSESTNGTAANRTTTAVYEDAGLSLGVAVNKIDDNGFINVVVLPKLTAPSGTQDFSTGTAGERNTLTLLSERSVSSGLIRLRDGQSLLLSGIIQDEQRSTVSKVPILGDLPLLGFLFRNDSSDNKRNELIVLVTPQILNDSDPYGGKGYNYSPSRDTKEFLQQEGLTIPNKP